MAQDFDYMINGIKATGTTPEQYGEVLGFMQLFNSRDPEQQGKALEMLDSMADRLALLLGKERASSDPLKNFPELQEAVTKGQITPQYAKELARQRAGNTFRTELQSSANQQEQQRQTANAELNNARNELNAIEATLKGTDPQWAAKRAQLVPVLQPIFKNLPPKQWPQAFKDAYAQLKLAPAPAAKTTVRKTQQPMRGGRGTGATGGGGTPKQASGSGLDAMNAALAELG
jgi:hypothetical protein